MPCDKFMQLPLEERLEILHPSSTGSVSCEVAYYVRVNPQTSNVEYQFPPSSAWVEAD